MPLLIGGLFNKRNRRYTPSESVASSPSNRASTDGDYVLPDKQNVYNLPAAASSGKLRLPFRRRGPAPRSGTKDGVVDAPSQSYISSVTSDPGHGLSPPPHKSSLFGAYNESFHSLPNESSSAHLHSDTLRPSSNDVRADSHSHSPPPPHKKSPGLFSWARERTKSKPSQPLPSIPPTIPSPENSSSFHLKSFRHISTDPPPTSPQVSLSNALLPPVRPRPRGDSVASDASQRISVAAFREAQARSRANSPVSSFRPPSTADTLRVDGNGRKRASTLSVVSPTERPQPNKSATSPPILARRPGSSMLDSSSEDSESEDDEEVDSDGVPIPQKPTRKPTITRRAEGPRARSDAGHTTALYSLENSSDRHEYPKSAQPSTNQFDQAPFTRPRASYSTSALTPSGAALKASVLAGTGSHAQPLCPAPNSRDDSDDSSDADSEDTPLSDLVPPQRPGSSDSNIRPRILVKPLIDIKSLAGSPPVLTPILRHEDSLKNLNTNHKEQDAEKDQPFSIPALLVHSSSASPSISPSVSKSDATSVNKPPSAAHHRRSSTDVPVLKDPENDDDLMNAIRLVGALDKEVDQPSEASKTSATTNRIVPTPIRAREPPTSFTVLSRPPQRRSTAETSVSLSPTWQNPPKSVPPALSPQPETGTRLRAAKMSPQNDKSDALSVSSAARSSRSSYRIPSVPLIHSIPDPPSVKEEYKPSHPRSSSRISAVNSAEARLQPVPALPSSTSSKVSSQTFQPSLMPQPPFASNRIVRGESPAGSSTGDSSSGRAPFTPGDGSEIGVKSKDNTSDVGSTLKARGHAQKLSVTFEDSRQPVRGRERSKTDLTPEEKTRERRRSEAKAAIELGKIVNGRGPLLHDDSDEDMGLRGRNPTINVTMDPGAHGMMPGWAPWQQPMGTGMAPMVPAQFSNDPAFLAAHQRALLIAKQAYQMAVAQHAMQVAGEEWERSSNTGFGSGGSLYGGGTGGSVYGGGSGGSVYGGGSGGSVYGGMGGGMGMMSMPNMGMLMPHNQWGRSSVAFPSGTASAYGGIGSSQSEYGGGGGGGWGTRSVYDPSSSSRGGGAPNSAASAYGSGSRPRARTGASTPSTSQPTRMPDKNAAQRSRAPPPSSWKNGR